MKMGLLEAFIKLMKSLPLRNSADRMSKAPIKRISQETFLLI